MAVIKNTNNETASQQAQQAVTESWTIVLPIKLSSKPPLYSVHFLYRPVTVQVALM